MYPVSADFHNKMKADRRQVIAKAQIDYTDPYMDQSVEVEANENANASYPLQTADNVETPGKKWASLDGSCIPGEGWWPAPGDPKRGQTGWWGSTLAGEGGAFSAPYPTLTITHLPRPARSLKAVGDNMRQEYPVDFDINLYAENGTLLKTINVTGNNSIMWSQPLAPWVLDVAKQELVVKKWSHAGRQVKILEFFTSIQETYLSGDLVSIKLLEEREASQGSLPVGNISANEIVLALNNEDGKFDVDNKMSPLANLLKANRRIRAWLGAEVESLEFAGWQTEILQDRHDNATWGLHKTSRLLAQGFKATTNLIGATKLRVGFMSDGSGTPPDIYFFIYNDNGGKPGVPISSAGVVPGTAWPSFGQFAMAEVILSEALQQGVQYWIVAQGQGTTTTPSVNVLASSISSYGYYPDGYIAKSDDTGATWSLYTNQDLAFKVEIPIYVTVIKPEWVPLGTFWSLDWDSPDDTLEATVTARDRMELLRKSIYETSPLWVNETLYNIATFVLQDAGLYPGEWVIDPSLQDIVIPYAWFEPMTHRDALRRIAEAGLATVYADRDGKIRIESFKTTSETSELTITEDDYFPPLSAPSKQEGVANEIVVTTQPIEPASAPEEVYKSSEPITVPANTTLLVTVQYSSTPVMDTVASLVDPPAGVSIDANETAYYAWGAKVAVQNTTGTDQDITIKVDGKPLRVLNKERVVVRDEASILDNGVLQYEFPANPLVQTLGQARAIANALLASFKDPRRDIEMTWRGNPALLLGDRITVKGQDYHVIRQEIEWAGALSARLTARKAGD